MSPEASGISPGYANEGLKDFFSMPLEERDPVLKASIDDELTRQQNQIELIASENIVSRAVMEAQGGADFRVAVGGDGNADAAAADQNAALRLSLFHGAGEGVAEIGIINRFKAIGAEIQDRETAAHEVVLDLVFEIKTGMVAGDGDGFRWLVRWHGK